LTIRFLEEEADPMATEITMPKLSDTMEEGRLVAWKKGVGDQVSRGDVLAEVETDKAVMELESFTSGVLLEVRARSGEMVAVGTVIAVVGLPDEKTKTAEEQEPAAQPHPEPEKQSVALHPPGEAPFASAPEPQTKIATEVKAQMAPAEVRGEKPREAESSGGERAAPAVRRYAREQGVDLTAVRGSGPDGRILHADVEKLAVGRQGGKEAAIEGEQPLARETDQASQITRMRSAIAKVVSESWRTIPHFSITVEVDMALAEKAREELKDSGIKVSINDMIIKAVSSALPHYSTLNSSLTGDRVQNHPSINIGFAVSLPEGLLVPVVKHCEQLSLAQIANETRGLVEKARNGRIGEQDISGGTFTVSNLGMYGVDEFTAIIMPPQGGILAVGGIVDRPVVKGGAVVVGRMMKMTVSADHRLVDGSYAAQFLVEVKRLLEAPVRMLV
jgi:pyruvate dehydrogenase E2 component (dihydrolipoamide acetyltransferase)